MVSDTNGEKTESKNNFEASEPSDLFKVEDFRQAMALIGVIANVSIDGAENLVSFGGGAMALAEGEMHSQRVVAGIEHAKKVDRLKVPRKAKDMADWSAGDSLSYLVKIAGVGVVGVHAVGVGVAALPMVEGEWKIFVTKLEDGKVSLKFQNTKDLKIRGVAGTIVLNSFVSAETGKTKFHSFELDLNDEQGQKVFKKLMKYKHLFNGGVHRANKAVKIAKNNGEYIIKTEDGKARLTVTDKRYLNATIPFLFRKSLGKKKEHEKLKLKTYDSSAESPHEVIQTFERETKYDQFKGVRKIWKKKNKHRFHKQVRHYEMFQAMQTEEFEGQLSYLGEAIFTYTNDGAKYREYEKALEKLAKFVDGSGNTPRIPWYPNSKVHGSVKIELKAALSDAGLRKLSADREEFIRHTTLALATDAGDEFPEHDQIKMLAKMNKDLIKMQEKLENQESILEKLKSFMKHAVKSRVGLRAISEIAPGELTLLYSFEGTDFRPYKIARTI